MTPNEILLKRAIDSSSLQFEALMNVAEGKEINANIEAAYHMAQQSFVNLQELVNRIHGIVPPKEG